MQRFAIKLTRAELNVLIEQIENFDLNPVFISKDGNISFHPWNYNGQEMVVIFDWSYRVPLTVYNINWFRKNGKTWLPKTNRRMKAKERRKIERLRS